MPLQFGAGGFRVFKHTQSREVEDTNVAVRPRQHLRPGFLGAVWKHIEVPLSPGCDVVHTVEVLFAPFLERCL